MVRLVCRVSQAQRVSAEVVAGEEEAGQPAGFACPIVAAAAAVVVAEAAPGCRALVVPPEAIPSRFSHSTARTTIPSVDSSLVMAGKAEAVGLAEPEGSEEVAASEASGETKLPTVGKAVMAATEAAAGTEVVVEVDFASASSAPRRAVWPHFRCPQSSTGLPALGALPAAIRANLVKPWISSPFQMRTLAR